MNYLNKPKAGAMVSCSVVRVVARVYGAVEQIFLIPIRPTSMDDIYKLTLNSKRYDIQNAITPLHYCTVLILISRALTVFFK